MIRKHLKRLSVVGASVIASGCIGLSGAAASAQSISLTGPGSFNAIMSHFTMSTSLSNHNNVSVGNFNNQSAMTGWAKVSDNTIGGSAVSGNASNWNNTVTNVEANNIMALLANMNFWGNNQGNGSIFLTGPGSRNIIETTASSNFTATNNNNVGITNGNNQTAVTGNATVAGNTIGGNAQTGDASNSNATETAAAISNNTSAPMNNVGDQSSNGGNIGLTGPGSTNVITSSFDSNFQQQNNNNVSVDNSSNQTARSGNATVAGNTIGGNAQSGSADNSNNTFTEVGVQNS